MARTPRSRIVARLLLLAILCTVAVLLVVSFLPAATGPDGRRATAGALFRQAPKPAG